MSEIMYRIITWLSCITAIVGIYPRFGLAYFCLVVCFDFFGIGFFFVLLWFWLFVLFSWAFIYCCELQIHS